MRPQERAAGTFAAAVREARTRSGLTQDQTAERSGVSRSTLIRWESGEITEPTLPQLKAFIAVVDTPAEDILRALELLPPAPAEPDPAAGSLGGPKPFSLADVPHRELLDELERRYEESDRAADAQEETTAL